MNNHAHILKPKRGRIEYLAGLLETLNYRPWITGAAQPKLTQDRLTSISICVAPPDEQERIITIANGETAPLKSAIARTECEIALLREYRTTLTADVVTGKLDVRAAAAGLPDEAEEPPPGDAEEIDNEPPGDACMSPTKSLAFRPREFKGSRFRCLLLTSQPASKVAAFLTSLVVPHASVTAADRYAPVGFLEPNRAKIRGSRRVPSKCRPRSAHSLVAR